MVKSALAKTPPTDEKRKVTPRRLKNRSYRDREHLEPKEVQRLQESARRHSRYGHRDATAILIAYRHGLRASELCDLTWDLINLDKGAILVHRAKGGIDSKHPLTGKEIRDLRKLRREHPESRFVFVTERGGPMSTSGFLKMVGKMGGLAKMVSLKVHPHMLRHACGFKLANDGVDTRTIQDYLGHADIKHTVIYTRLQDTKFNGIWKD
jgi:integrase